MSMSRDNLDFGRDCAEVMGTLIGVLSQLGHRASRASAICGADGERARVGFGRPC